jgi:magnesium-transporting ATPase (P-type)
VSCDKPDRNLYYFEGIFSVLDSKKNVTDVLKIDLSNFLPRGAIVCNCEFYALVVYTGKDSKIILNQGHYSYKTSSLEKKLNKIFLWQGV